MSSPSTIDRRWLAVGIGAVAAFVFLPALWNGFVNFDDRLNLVENPRYRGLGLAELGWMATTFHLGHWQPLSWLSFALDYGLWGMNPAGYHLTSLLLHATSAALLFLLAERLLARAGVARPMVPAGAAIAALFWALHPLRVESVAWATERRDVLCGVFTLLALLAYVAPGERPGRLAATFAAAVLATAAKASAMVLPVLLVILDVYPLRRLGGEAGWTGARAWKVWREKLPFLALGLVSGSIALAAQRSAGALAPLSELSIATRVGSAMYGVGFYLSKTVAPVGLVALHEFPRDFGPLHPLALWGAAVAGAAAAVAIVLGRRCPGVAAALAAYVVALGPTLGGAQSGLQLVADRYSYFAALGPAVLVGGVVATVARTPARAAAVLPLLLAFALLTARQVTTWRDGTTLWTHAIAAQPENALAHANLGDVAFQAGDYETAVRRFGEAIALRPDVATIHRDLALSLAALHMFDAAVAENREAIRLEPRFAAAWASLGVALANLRRDEEAIAAYRQALALDPARADIRTNLAELLAEGGQLEEALSEYRAALRSEPSAVAFNNMGLLHMQAGRPAEAAAAYREALRLRPDAAPVHENLGYALSALGDTTAALRELETAVRLDPRAEGARRAAVELQARTR